MPNKEQRGLAREELSQDLVDQVVSSVAELTYRHGFHAMTLSMVAEHSKVPLGDVVHVGSKPELVLMACRAEGVGDAEWASVAREDRLSAALTEENNAAALELLVGFLADVNPRRHALWLAARMAVNHDPRLAASLTEISEGRRELYLLLAGLLIARGFVPTTASRDELAAQLGAVISAEAYEFMHQVMGFDADQYAQWLTANLPRQLRAWNYEHDNEIFENK